jgi:N-methylhydantoinase A
LVTTDQGLDPRDFTLLPFGGAGPLHACELALELGIQRVLIPPTPGVLSALGLAGADVKTGALTAVNRSLAEVTPERVNALCDQLEGHCLRILEAHGIDPADRVLSRSADLRYTGQSFEVTVPLPGGPYDQAALDKAAASYHQAHEDLYKYSMPTELPFLVNLEVTAVGRTPKPVYVDQPLVSGQPQPLAERPVYYLAQQGFRETPVYGREDLRPGQSICGPAIVDQFDSTILVLPEFTARTDTNENLILERNN